MAARKSRDFHDQNDLMPGVRRDDLRYRQHLPALRGEFQRHRRRPGRACDNAGDRGFIRFLAALRVNRPVAAPAPRSAQAQQGTQTPPVSFPVCTSDLGLPGGIGL